MVACHLYHSSQMLPQNMTFDQEGRDQDYFTLYSSFPSEGEFTVEPEFKPDLRGLPGLDDLPGVDEELANFGPLNLSRDPSCAQVFLSMLSSDYSETKSQALCSIATAIRYPGNKEILMGDNVRSAIMSKVVKFLDGLRVGSHGGGSPLMVRSALVIIREAFCGGQSCTDVFSDKQRFHVLKKVVQRVLRDINKWESGTMGWQCVMTEGIRASKELIANASTRMNKPKLLDLIQKLQAIQMPLCTAECEYCRGFQASEKRARTLTPASEMCPLQPYQSPYFELQNLVETLASNNQKQL